MTRTDLVYWVHEFSLMVGIFLRLRRRKEVIAVQVSEDGDDSLIFSHTDLILLISEAAVIFCHAESDLTLFYCNKRASRCG